MQRFVPALVALLAAVALVTAAGSFDAVESPSIDADSSPEGSVDRQGGGSAPETPTGPESNRSAGGSDGTTPGSSDGGGVSAILVALLVGVLVVGAVLVVLLTDDDARAPARDEGGSDEGGGSPTPAVDPDYDPPGDNAVVRAWHGLAQRVDADEEATPGETARAALDRGLPREAVGELTRHFEAVRYGRAPATEREASAAAVSERLGDGSADAGTTDGDGTPDPTDRDSDGERP